MYVSLNSRVVLIAVGFSCAIKIGGCKSEELPDRKHDGGASSSALSSPSGNVRRSTAVRDDAEATVTVPGKKAPPAAPQDPKLRIEVPENGKRLAARTRISVRGTHSLSPENHVWIFLIDIFGGWYLQNPPVSLNSSGQWAQNNVRPGKGIIEIVVIRVDKEGNRRVQRWVSAGRWGRIVKQEVAELSGYEELDRVQVETPSPD